MGLSNQIQEAALILTSTSVHPQTSNILPIWRLNLAIGETATVQAAWLRFPSFKLELLSQQYHRLDETTYRYKSAGGQFVAELKVNEPGFVVEYLGIWRSEVISE
jgi:hypothetical protein